MRHAYKGATAWNGYKVHLTETCDDETPNLITNVETTTAAVADDAVTEQIHAALDGANLLPEKHIAGTGSVNAKLIVDSHDQYGVKLIGHTRRDNPGRPKMKRGSPRATSPSTGSTSRRRARPARGAGVGRWRSIGPRMR